MRAAGAPLPLMVFTLLLLLVPSGSGGAAPDNGYCIGSHCYAAFTTPGGFDDAQTQCAERNGHLMTVRSSVSHDTLQILLGGLQGRFWIGLHLPTGCPSSVDELRGFQWVTADAESDYYNWAGPPGAGCSARCVAVSKEDDFRWTPVSCGERAAGFLCEYGLKEPCPGLRVTAGESVTYGTPYGFEGEDMLTLPQGSVAVRRPALTKHICHMQQWRSAPWQCEIAEGGCEHKCAAVDNQHAPVCFCPEGRVVDPRNNVTCRVAEDDPCHLLGCEHACHRDEHGYACMCRHGFKLAADGTSCRDLNDCADPRQCPGDGYECVNTVGGYECVCGRGYVLTRDGRCEDVNECLSYPCEHECDDKLNGYVCSCHPGYRVREGAPHECEVHCNRSECPAQCDPNNPYQCFCPTGYVVDERNDGNVCMDLDECRMNYCEQGCQNSFGSYKCFCLQGFTLVAEYRCVEDETDPHRESAWTTVPSTTTTGGANVRPTGSPSTLAAGGLLSIILLCMSASC